MAKVKIECNACGATGLYKGFAEPPGTAVVCLYCKGTGAKEIDELDKSPRMPLFSSRKPKNGIQYVQRSAGTFILSCGPTGGRISYDDFQRGMMP